MKFLKTIENAQLQAVCNIYNLFRIQLLSCEKYSSSTYVYKATLYRDNLSLRVTWLEKQKRKDLGYGVLVRAQWLTKKVFLEATNIIHTVSSVSMLSEDEGLDGTIIPAWMQDSLSVSALLANISSLPKDYRALINHIFKNHYVLYHFLKTPWSLNADFKNLGGNLDRTLLQLEFPGLDTVAQRLMRPKEQLVAAIIILGIGHYNQFEYDTLNHAYKNSSATVNHDARQEAIDLINNARVPLKMKNPLTIDSLISVIMQLDFEY